MIRRANECLKEVRDAMRGGPGSVELTSLATKEEMYNKGRMMSIIRLKAGCGIGVHEHNGECEIFYIVSGNATYYDDDKTYEVFPGDVTIVEDGHKHGITNASGEDCVVVAVILNH